MSTKRFGKLLTFKGALFSKEKLIIQDDCMIILVIFGFFSICSQHSDDTEPARSFPRHSSGSRHIPDLMPPQSENWVEHWPVKLRQSTIYPPNQVCQGITVDRALSVTSGSESANILDNSFTDSSARVVSLWLNKTCPQFDCHSGRHKAIDLEWLWVCHVLLAEQKDIGFMRVMASDFLHCTRAVGRRINILADAKPKLAHLASRQAKKFNKLSNQKYKERNLLLLLANNKKQKR